MSTDKQKVSLNEIREMLQTNTVELCTEVTLTLGITLDNVSEETFPLPNAALTTIIHFPCEETTTKEYGVMAEGDMTDLLAIEDVSQALHISMDTKVWSMRIIEAS